MTTSTITFRPTVGQAVRVGDHPEVGYVESAAPATLGGEVYAVIYWPATNGWTTHRAARLRPSNTRVTREAARAAVAAVWQR